MKSRFSFLISFLFIINGHASLVKELDTLPKPGQVLDSLIFSKKLDWSVRLVTNFKQQQFRLGTEDHRLIYRPNNPFGVGIGLANQKIVIDVLFNIKTGNKDQTKKFAAEGSLIFNKNLFGFIVENVHGYQVESRQNRLDGFRDDLSAYSVGLEYLHILSKEDFTIRDMKSGSKSKRKTFVSYGVGGFLITRGLSADASIIPEADRPYFNEQAEIHGLSTIGAGVLGGISSYFNLPGHFFATCYFGPGIGLEYKYVQTETGSYVPSDPFVFKADFFAAMGYNRKRFYVHFTFGTDWYLTSLDYNNNIFLSVTKSKFIVGYHIGKLWRK